MRKTKIYPIAIAILTIVALFALPLAVASAGPPSAIGKATGSVGMSGPMQYMSFNAFDFGATGDRGQVAYTNFDAPAPGTGVWKPAASFDLIFPFGGVDYTHEITITEVTPLATNSIAFAGTGAFVAPPGSVQTSMISGTVTGGQVSFDLVYDLGAFSWPGYSYASANGAIQPNGSVAGTATEFLNGVATLRVLDWMMPAASVFEVFSYTVPVTGAEVDPDNATASFCYTIPSDAAIAAGVIVVWKVTDGGSPAAVYDTLGFATPGSCNLAAGVGLQTPVSGNLTVHN